MWKILLSSESVHVYTYLNANWKQQHYYNLGQWRTEGGFGGFITALTSVRHMSLSWASPIQSIFPHPTTWRSILILSTYLRLCLPSGSFPPVSPPRPYTPPSPHPYVPHASPPPYYCKNSQNAHRTQIGSVRKAS